MVGWHHLLSGHEFEQAQGDGEGQKSQACCSSQGHKQLDTTEQLNNEEIFQGNESILYYNVIGDSEYYVFVKTH